MRRAEENHRGHGIPVIGLAAERAVGEVERRGTLQGIQS